MMQETIKWAKHFTNHWFCKNIRQNELGVYVYGFGTNGMASGFLDMMKLLFKGAKIVICLHKGIKNPLDVQKKVNKDTLVVYFSPNRWGA